MNISSTEKFKIFRNSWLSIDNYFSMRNYSVQQEVVRLQNTRYLKMDYASQNGTINASFGYLPLDAFDNDKELVFGNIYCPNQLSISIYKFGEIEFGYKKDDFSLLTYPGSFEERVSVFCKFYLSILLSPKLVSILDGNNWSDNYYVPWYEGTGY